MRRATSATKFEQPSLAQFIVLSMLLHLFVIVLFGTARTSIVPRGDSLTGGLDVTLRNLSEAGGSGLTLAPGADTKSAGTAILARPNGATSRTVPRPRAEQPEFAPPAAGAPAEQAPPPASEPPRPAPAPAAAEPSAPAQPIEVETLPRLNLDAPKEVDKPYVPSPSLPAKVETEAPPIVAQPPRPAPIVPVTPLERIAPATPLREFAPAPDLRPRVVPIAPVTPLEPIEAPTPLRELPPPVDPRPRVVPIAPITPITPLEPIEAPTPLREMPPPVNPRPRVAPIAPVTPLEPIEAPTPLRELPPPVDPRPRVVPIAPITPLEPIGPPPAARVAPAGPRENAPSDSSVQRGQPATPSPATERRTTPAAASESSPGTTAPARTGSPTEPPGRLRFGAPTAPDDIFKPRGDASAPTTAPGSAAPPDPPDLPRIDIEATKRRAREIDYQSMGGRGLVPLPIPEPPAKKPTLSESMAKAFKPDCRDAYAALGLLAVPALVASTIGNGGCRW